MFRNNFQLIKTVSALHTASIFNGKEAKAMRKIMGTKKRKFHPVDAPTLPSTMSSIFGKTSFETKVTGNPRRSSVLNKLFMRHVTDLMATGEYSSQIVGYGIEVNKVQITPDYKILKVYWIAKKTEDHESIDNILTKNAGFLRHELSALRVMGEVPTIVFVKDKNYSKIVEVEQKLAVADFGEDYQQPELAENLKSSYELWTALDCTIKAKLERLDSEVTESEEDDLDEIPPMPQNVLGLDHANILNRIQKRMTASEAPHRKDAFSQDSGWSQFKMTQSVNSDPVAYASQQQQRQAFKDFWQQRQILKMKQRRLDKNWTPDMEFLREEMRERHLRNLESCDIEPQQEDYVLDDFEDNDDQNKGKPSNM